ncbi:MAG: hypothetical protein J6V07_05090 [Clostridia bacterium]|nr:hypothetical protein [Clostridia bacterium]
MRLLLSVRTYFEGLTPRSVRLLFLGLIPIFIALGFLVSARLTPGFPYGALWLTRAFAFWVDSVGVSLLLLIGGVALLSYAEKKDAEE